MLTRARYLAKSGGGNVDMASRSFDLFHLVKNGASSSDDHIDPVAVQADLDKAVDDGERVCVFAERTRAHRSKEKGLDKTLTFRDLHRAIDDIREIVAQYYLLLKQATINEWEPTAQYDTIAAFLQPWVTDRAAVEAVDDGDPPPPAENQAPA